MLFILFMSLDCISRVICVKFTLECEFKANTYIQSFRDRRGLCVIDGFFEGFCYGRFQQKLEKCGNHKIKMCLQSM